jgi:hypothetical protein
MLECGKKTLDRTLCKDGYIVRSTLVGIARVIRISLLKPPARSRKVVFTCISIGLGRAGNCFLPEHVRPFSLRHRPSAAGVSSRFSLIAS